MHLKAEDVAVIVSPMLRAIQTASIALKWLGVPFETDAHWQGAFLAFCS